MQTPWMQSSPGCRPPGCRPPWMQTPWMQTPPLDADPPSGCRSPWSCDLWCMLGSQPSLWTEWQSGVKTLPCPKLCLRVINIISLAVYKFTKSLRPSISTDKDWLTYGPVCKVCEYWSRVIKTSWHYSGLASNLNLGAWYIYRQLKGTQLN